MSHYEVLTKESFCSRDNCSNRRSCKNYSPRKDVYRRDMFTLSGFYIGAESGAACKNYRFGVHRRPALRGAGGMDAGRSADVTC
jgi:hypothetical protein